MLRKKVLLSLLIIPLIASTSFAARKQMSLQVKKGELRSSPSFLSTVTATVKYGDRMTVIQKNGDWIKVAAPQGDRSGWIHSSALTKKKIKIAAGSKDAELAASSGELALAGKGFNSDVEAEFKAKNKSLDFTWIDRMERFRITLTQSKRFLKQGQVTTPKGGAK